MNLAAMLRFRMRTLWVAVALAALLSGAETVRRHRASETLLKIRTWSYKSKVDEQRRQVSNRSDEERSNAKNRIMEGLGPEPRPTYAERVFEYHGKLTLKYEAAAARPWLPVEPDPPPGER